MRFPRATHLVILFADPQDREDVEVLLKVRLAQFGLSVAEDKTHKTDLGQRENRGKDRRHLSFLGFTVYRRKSRSGKGVTTVFQTEGKRFARAKAAMKEKLKRMMHVEVKQQVAAINAMLIGHFNYYGMAGNMPKLESFWYLTVRHWRRCLSRRSQKGAVNWKQMNAILAANPLVRPRIRIPYPALATYVRL